MCLTKGQVLCLDTVSTTCGSGWVMPPVQELLTSYPPVTQVVLTVSKTGPDFCGKARSVHHYIVSRKYFS